MQNASVCAESSGHFFFFFFFYPNVLGSPGWLEMQPSPVSLGPADYETQLSL